MEIIKNPIHKMRCSHKQVLKQIEKLEQATITFRDGGSVQNMILSLDGFLLFEKIELAIHLKDEEEALFPVLRANGHLGKEIEEILGEHDYLYTTIELLKLMKHTDGKSAKYVQKKLEDIAGTLRDHIWKEDNVIFKIAEEMLSAEDMNEVGKKMALFRHR
jgi:hemerythrin-like domain-containing protein